TRLGCDLGNATSDQTREYNRVHQPNENPVLSKVELKHANGTSETLDPLATTPVKLKLGETVTFRATWPACPVEPKCGDDICSEGEKGATCNTKNGDVCCPADCDPPNGPKGCGGP